MKLFLQNTFQHLVKDPVPQNAVKVIQLNKCMHVYNSILN